MYFCGVFLYIHHQICLEKFLLCLQRIFPEQVILETIRRIVILILNTLLMLRFQQ